MDISQLRPLGLGELLDRTFAYYRRHFWLFVGIMALPQVLTVLFGMMMTALEPRPMIPIQSPDPLAVLRQLGPLLAGLFAFVTAFSIGRFIVYGVALGATTEALSEVHLGRPASVRGAYAKLRGRVGSLIGLIVLLILIGAAVYTFVFAASIVMAFILGVLIGAVAGHLAGLTLTLVVGLTMVVTMVGAFVLGSAFLLRYGVAVPALVLENLSATQALRRSAMLTQGFRWNIFLILLLMIMINAVVVMLFQGPFLVAGAVLRHGLGVMPAWLRAPYVISAGLAGALSGPLLMIALSLVYYDTRVRKEGFDLEMMLSAIGPPSSPALPSPVPPGSP
jgi:hypothetical protein